MATGTVKWFNDSKGYGFIAPEDGGKDLFVHHSNVAGDGFKTLSEGARVEYEQREGAKGPEATNVAVVGRDEAVTLLFVEPQHAARVRRGVHHVSR